MLVAKLHGEGQFSLGVGTAFDNVMVTVNQALMHVNNSLHIFEVKRRKVLELNRPPPPGNVCAEKNDARLEDCFDRFFATAMGCILPWKERADPVTKGWKITCKTNTCRVNFSCRVNLGRDMVKRKRLGLRNKQII